MTNENHKVIGWRRSALYVAYQERISIRNCWYKLHYCDTQLRELIVSKLQVYVWPMACILFGWWSPKR